MNLNARLFDKIRIKPAEDPTARPDERLCDHKGCRNAGMYRAPKGRDREGEYFLFCMDHVRAYNSKYNYFKDMEDEQIQAWQKDALTGHRPTWKMGQNAAPLKDGARPRRTAKPEHMDWQDPLGAFKAAGFNPRGQRRSRLHEEAPSIGNAARKSYEVLGLEPGATKAEVSTRYKDMLKRLHPDVNGGDRSTEGQLQAVIRAHKTLKAAGLA
ncbi:MAG: J domain-containing protein [Beijerinckiaceae bacterium]